LSSDDPTIICPADRLSCGQDAHAPLSGYWSTTRADGLFIGLPRARIFSFSRLRLRLCLSKFMPSHDITHASDDLGIDGWSSRSQWRVRVGKHESPLYIQATPQPSSLTWSGSNCCPLVLIALIIPKTGVTQSPARQENETDPS